MRLLRQVSELCRLLSVFLPPLKFLELSFPHPELPNACGKSSLFPDGVATFFGGLVLLLELVGCADLYLVEFVEQVEMGDEKRVDCVEPFGVLNEI